MSFSQVLKEVTERNGETQHVAAQAAHVTNGTISKYIRGVRKPPKDVMKSLSAHYDDPALHIAAANEVTNGAFVPWLNLADLHKSNVHIKTLEEINEAMASMDSVPITKRRDQLTDRDLKAIRQSIMEQIEAITALFHNVAVLCREYGFSWRQLWQEHHKELRGKRYMN